MYERRLRRRCGITPGLFLVGLLLPGAVVAQVTPPELEWTRIFFEGDADSILETGDGGYLIVGSRLSDLGSDVYLLKTDAAGRERWSRAYGSAGTSYSGRLVQATSDGGYVVAGAVTSHSGIQDSDVYLLRTDADGDEIWSRTFGGGSEDWAASVCEASDGGFLLVGATSSFGAGDYDVYLVKTDGEGNEVWFKTFGGSRQDRAYSIQETADGGYVFTGEANSFGAGMADVYLVKTDAAGNEIWSRTFGGAEIDGGDFVQQTRDGGYIVTGSRFSLCADDRCVYLLKADGDGNEVWSRSLGVPGPGFDSGKVVRQTRDGGFVVVSGFGLIKTDENGQELWTQSWADASEGWFIAWSVQQTNDGGYVVGGMVDLDDDDRFNACILKFGPESWDSPMFRRGDANGDGGLNLADAVFVLLDLFSGEPHPLCEKSTDADDSGTIEITDAVRVLSFLFLGGAPPESPFPECGPDPTPDELECESYEACQDE